MGIFECHNLTKNYGQLTALDSINLDIGSGRVVGLLGPNGSGKTTLIKLATRMLQPTSGEILIGGQKPSAQTKAIVSYLPDRNALPEWMSVDRLIGMYGDFYQDFDPGMARYLLGDLQVDQSMALRKLSKGNREKVQLILTLARNAAVYLLDEPIAGVDPATRDYILRTIITSCSKESLVLISTHLIADVESVLNEAIFLKQGHILLYQPAEVIRNQTGKTIDNYFREVFAC